ncbi:MAG: aminopeptidase-like protein [Colwellia sp.]|jgi:aminopeptidase-like protein
MTVLSLVKKIFPFNYSITGLGNDQAINQYLSELDFTVHEYASGQSLNGWYIPHAWQVSKATISHNDILIYDAKKSPLSVAALSPSFNGELSFAELDKHLVSSESLPNAVLYQWHNLYRSKELDWAISIPHSQRADLVDVKYLVDIQTQLKPSTMKVLDYLLKGESDETIVINGHNCHPFQANDDISGCAVAIRVIQALQQQSKRKYSYRIIIAPELHGPMFWLNELNNKQQAQLKACILLKSVGNSATMRLQRSYLGSHTVDKAAQLAFKKQYGNFEQGAFRTIYGNDETVFEAPPYNIPTISLTRWPFSEYHSDLDTPDTLSEAHLQDSVDLVINIIDCYENNFNKGTHKEKSIHIKSSQKERPINQDASEANNAKFNLRYQINFNGLVCLSAYGLYKSIPQVSNKGVDYDSLHGRWNKLMNCLPREIDDKMTVAQLAKKYSLPEEELYQYLELWLEHGLLKPCK